MAKNSEPVISFGTDKALTEVFITEGTRGEKVDFRVGRVFHRPGGEVGRTTYVFPDEDSIKTLFESLAAAHAYHLERKLTQANWSVADAQKQVREQLPDWILEHLDGRAAVKYAGSAS